MRAREWLERFGPEQGPSEADVKELLASRGLAVPQSTVIAAGDLPASPAFNGPYAVKAVSAAILHKTEQRALLLDVPVHELDRAVGDLAGRYPGVPLLVERMVTGVSVEMIVGAVQDPDLGTAIMAGAGGVLAELYRDVAFRLVPCTERDVDRMLDELRLAPLLSGYRGMPADRDGLRAYIVGIAALVAELGDHVAEFDVNPLVFAEGRWIALDAKMVLRR